VRYWFQEEAADRVERDAEVQRAARKVHLTQSFEFCEVPAEDCQIDHVLERARGGPTRTWNGRPACGYHNRRRSRGP
jgi:hypothetical protein